jgi:hypothetical protein
VSSGSTLFLIIRYFLSRFSKSFLGCGWDHV